jgi:DNA end-binding protein Ku
LRKVIEAKVAGQEVVTPPEEEQPQVTDLMAALRKSLDQAKARSASKTPELASRPARIKKPSTAAKRAASSSARPRRRVARPMSSLRRPNSGP